MMKIHKKLPFWIKVRHYFDTEDVYSREILFLIQSYDASVHYYYGTAVTKQRVHQRHHYHDMYRVYRQYRTGCYGFKLKLLQTGRKPTKKELEYGKRLIKEWDEHILIEEI